MARKTIPILAALALAATTGTAATADSYFFRSRPAVIESAAKPAPDVSLATATLPAAKVGKPWTFDFAALATRENLVDQGLTWSGSGLPPWMTVAPATGVTSGTPAVVGDATFEVVATNRDATGRQTFTVRVG